MNNLVTVKPIRTEADFDAAIFRIGELMNSPVGSREFDELDVLTSLAKAYENDHHFVPVSDPVDAVQFVMEQNGMNPVDLVPFLGAQSRVSEFLNRKRKLSTSQIRRLHDGLGIPTSLLFR